MPSASKGSGRRARRQPGMASKSVNKRAGSDPNIGRRNGSGNGSNMNGHGNAGLSGTP